MGLFTLFKNTFLRRALALLVAVLVLGLAATLALPSLIKSQAESRGSQALGRALTIGAVDFKPWTLELTVSDIKLASADAQSTQLAVSRLYVNAAIASVWKMAPVIDALTIEQPQVKLALLGGGRYDIDDLIERFKPEPDAAPSAPVLFALHNIELKDGSVELSDRSGAAERQHALRKLELAVPFVSNFEAQREVTVQPRLAFELNGSGFDTGVQATPFASAPKGEARIALKQLDITPYLPYLPASLPVRLKSAVLDSTLSVVFEQAATNQLHISGTIDVSNIRVDQVSGAPLLSVASVQVALKDLRPLEQSLSIDSVRMASPQIALTRNAAGQWLLPGAGSPTVAAAKPAPAQEPAAQTGPKSNEGSNEGSNESSSAETSSGTSPPGGWKVALDKLELQNGEVRLTDESVAPVAKLSLANTQVALTNLQWPLTQAAQLELSTQLQPLPAGKSKPATIQIKGEGTDAQGSVNARLSDLALALAAPYIRPYFLPQVQGMLEGELNAQWKGGGVQVTAPRVALRDLALLPAPGSTDVAAKDLPSLKLLEVNKLELDVTQRSVLLGSLVVRGPKVRVARDREGQWMYSRWLPPAEAVAAGAGTAAAPMPAPAKGAKPAAASPPWSVKLANIALDEGLLTYVDRVPDKTVFLELSDLQARIKDLLPDGRKPMLLNLTTTVRSGSTDPGKLHFDGSVMWDPVVAEGKLEATQLPVQAVAPYVMRALRLELMRADTSFKGQLRYAGLPAGPEVQVRGDAAIEELTLNSFALAGDAVAGSAQPSEELLTWKALSVPGIEFSMSPGAATRLKLREVSLSDFFARLIINPAGRLVLQDIVRPEDIGPPKPEQAAAAGAATPAASAAATTATTTAAPATPAAVAPAAVIDVGPIKLVNGRVAFSDRFIQPNYSANLTALTGSLSSFSSANPQGGVQMADLELRGRAEGTASLEITGKLNPLAKPLALDISGRVRDLELSPLSSYAIKYAGYGIERGKLSVDVKYNVTPDGKLQANNKIVLNQLVFGDEVAGAANRLPVKLAVALLADRNGVIDLDLPLSGSLNDPEFKVWPIVWKIVGNIVAKALTAPFNLIGGLFSGGDGAAEKSSAVPFEPGTTRISAAGQQSLDKLAQALKDKPSLRLTLVGHANLEREGDAIRRARLAAQLLSEKRRAAATAGKDVTAVVAVAAEEVPALLKEVFRRSDVKKPRNLVGLAKDLPPAEMEALLLGSYMVDDDTARELALSRSVTVREYLTAQQLSSDRLFLGSSKTTAEGEWQPRVELELERK